MSPIDDELRAALHGRASTLAPSPDPLAGIERRAQRIQRTRIGAAVAASVLAVSAIAVAVPALQSATSSGPDGPRVATAPPSAEPTPTTRAYALDPADPWAYRGDDLELLGPGTLDTIEREFGIRHGTNDVELTPLFGQVWEPSQKFELFFLAAVDGEYRWGVSETPNDAGPEFLWDSPLAGGQDSLAVALPGDEVARLLVVAAPEATAIEYSPRPSSDPLLMTVLADGVAVGPLAGDLATDSYRVTWGSFTTIVDAPDPAEVVGPIGQPAAALDPENPWELRGQTALLKEQHVQGIAADFANRKNMDVAGVQVVPLYIQDGPEDAEVEVAYLVRDKEGPWFWGVSALFEGGWWWYAEQELRPGTKALVATVPRDADQFAVLVVAAPSMGGAVFGPAGDGWQPMEDLAPGVFGTVQAGPVEGTRYKVLDGNGDLDNPAAEGEVPPYQNAG